MRAPVHEPFKTCPPVKGQDTIKENRVADFRSALASGRTLLLDGGMGTMLQARGLPAGSLRREPPKVHVRMMSAPAAR